MSTSQHARSLMCLTTYNHVEYTIAALKSITRDAPSGMDILIIDDQSKDNTTSILKEMGYSVIKKTTDKGLTHSWNMAYKKFKHEGYDQLFLVNNDILVPPRTLSLLTQALHSYPLVVPVSSKLGCGWNKKQAVCRYHKDIKDDDASIPENYEAIQEAMLRKPVKSKYKHVYGFNGFFFGVNRKIIQSEFDTDQLFDPQNLMYGQETDLGWRLKEKVAIVLNAFVFHFKTITIGNISSEVKNKLGLHYCDAIDFYRGEQNI